MKRAAGLALKATAGLAAVIPAALTGLSAYLILGAALLALTIVAALCWIITDPGRSERLVTLIDATRGNDRQVIPKLGRADLPPAEPKHDKAA